VLRSLLLEHLLRRCPAKDIEVDEEAAAEETLEAVEAVEAAVVEVEVTSVVVEGEEEAIAAIVVEAVEAVVIEEDAEEEEEDSHPALLRSKSSSRLLNNALSVSVIDSYRNPGNAPVTPDTQVIAIEDAYMKNSKGINALANLSTTTRFPPRPGHGTLGKKIVVYANYFKVIAPPNLSLTRYNVEVSPPATGKKLGRIFQLLLELPAFSGVATEWKSMIISTKNLNLPPGYTVQIPYRKEGEDEPPARAVTYNVRVITPLTYLVSDLIKFLASQNPQPPYTQKAEVIQMMNAVFGCYPQAHPGVTSIGQNRHFALDRSQQNAHNIHVLGGGLESLRGYFLSARPATGGLLLNVNVTHGVFFEPDRLDTLYPKLGTGNKTTLAKKLNKLRVRVTHLPGKKNKKNEDVPRIKMICGLALTNDGRSEEHPPKITVNYAGPTQVSFWLSDTPPGSASAGPSTSGKGKKSASQQGGLPVNQYITVYNYFQKSMFSCL